MARDDRSLVGPLDLVRDLAHGASGGDEPAGVAARGAVNQRTEGARRRQSESAVSGTASKSPDSRSVRFSPRIDANTNDPGATSAALEGWSSIRKRMSG